MLKVSRIKFTASLLIGLVAFALTSSTSSSQNKQLRDSIQYENIAKGKTYTFSAKPNYALCSDFGDDVQLTDGVYTSGYFWAQKTTVGWQGKRPVVITFDLGKIEPIRGVSYNTAAGTAAGCTWPVSVYVLVSTDGTNYFTIGDLVALSNKCNLPPTEGYAVHRYWIDSMRTFGRYVQLVIDPGGPYCFIDEIEIYRGEYSWITQQPMGVPSRGGIDFFRSNVVNNSIKSRLYSDVREARDDIKRSGLGERKVVNLLAELDAIDLMIPRMPHVDPKSFAAILPINDLQALVFSVRAKMRRLKGLPPIETWVSNPLDYITPTQNPDSASRRHIDVAMIRGEWRSAVFNLKNSGPNPAHIQFSINGLPGGNNPNYISVYEVQWTDTTELKLIGAALKKISCTKSSYFTIIPAGMVRQIWLSFHPVNILPGDYTGRIIINKLGGNKHGIPLKFRLFPLTFPEMPTLHIGGWDYTDSDTAYGVTVKNRDALIAHLQERFVDSPWATSRVLPFGDFDLDGNFLKKPDTSQFNAWIARWTNARRYYVFLNVGDSLAGSPSGSEAFVAKVKTWINYWVEYAATKGLQPEQLFLLLLDEPSSNDKDRVIISWAKAIRAAQPKVMLWEDPAYRNPENAMEEMMSSVDVLCPNRIQMLNEGKHFEDFYRKQNTKGRRLDLFSCSGPMHLLDPYSYIRLQAWACWDMGAESTLFWSFCDTGRGNPWNPYLAYSMNFAPMFLAPDSVTPGKHMEALRESVEDFEYFVMLKDAIAKTNTFNPALPKANELLQYGARRVLDATNANKLNWSDDKDRWIAEEVRLEILKTIVALKSQYANRH